MLLDFFIIPILSIAVATLITFALLVFRSEDSRDFLQLSPLKKVLYITGAIFLIWSMILSTKAADDSGWMDDAFRGMDDEAAAGD